MAVTVPQEVRNWLSGQGYTIQFATAKTGNFASTLHKVSVKDATSKEHALILKYVSKDAREPLLYAELGDLFGTYGPPLRGVIATPTGFVLVLEAFGEALEDVWPSLPTERKSNTLRDIVTWLAAMHVHLRPLIQQPQVREMLDLYPENTAQTWRSRALDELQWAAKEHFIEANIVAKLQAMEREFAAYVNSREGRVCRNGDGHLTITHGDCHMGNVLMKAESVCLIDWEYASIAAPQRDLTALLQGIGEGNVREELRQLFYTELCEHGWNIDHRGYLKTFDLYLFDNTLMMLGWEIGNVRSGTGQTSTLSPIINRKAQWLENGFQGLLSAK